MRRVGETVLEISCILLNPGLHMVLGYAGASLAASAFPQCIRSAQRAHDGRNMPPEVATGSIVFLDLPFVALFVAYFAFVPAVVVMLLAELLGKRDWLFHALSGGVVALLLDWLFVPELRHWLCLRDPLWPVLYRRQRPCRRHRLLVLTGRFAGALRDDLIFAARLERKGGKRAPAKR